VFLGQLKLVGGALAAVGGVVLMGYDLKDGLRALKEAKHELAFAHYLRFLAAIAMVGSQSSIAFAAAGPMLKILAERGGKSYALTSLLLVAARASSFLGRPAMLALLRSLLLRSTLIGIAATLAIAVFDDDALEKWCKRSTYRGVEYQGNSPHNALENELADLYSALLEII
ncbi:MAG: hypothetical protein QHC88_08215, partial [Achromobacter sp.]|uniref:hypothetical protein n=1 Tax=Achromobacter sp. TaxID=134375 RepID=UPI0029B4A082